MVQLESESSARPLKAKASVKLEIDDFVEEEFSPLSKRSRPCVPSDEDSLNPWSWKASVGGGACNPLEEPSPLGLQLRKSPSLLDLIQMKLSQESAVTSRAICSDSARRRDGKGGAAAGVSDKLKASNFPASILRIGTWECLSRYEGDLVAKCYFAKHKLVWEVLGGSLKSKIEIQWSDITALKASCPENGPGTLDVVMARQPLFFRETNPQPRKHTLWQATSDFTGGQASIHRRHFLQCAPGLLSKHFEKLIRCDRRLYALSQQPEFVLDSPYFEPRCSIFEAQENACHARDHVKGDYGTDFPGFCDASSTCSAPSSSSKSGLRDPIGRMETPSPISGVNSSIIEEDTNFRIEKLRDPSGWDSLKIPGLHPSMSMTDLVNHIGNCFSGKSSTSGQLLSDSSPMNLDMLEEIAHYLLGDGQSSSVLDEKSLMVRVNSLCCLLQKPTSTQNIVQTNDALVQGSGCTDKKIEESARQLKPLLKLGVVEEVKGERMPAPAISREDSVGELLVHLPRIASHPCIFFNKLNR